MRIVPYIPLSTIRITIGSSYCTAVASSWPAIRKSPSPEKQTTVRSGRTRLGGDRRRDAVAHRAAGRRELARELVEPPEAMHPDRVVARAVRDDRVGHAFAQVREAHGEVDRAGHRRSAAATPRSRHAPRRTTPPSSASTRRSRTAAANCAIPERIGSVGLVDAAELLGARMHVHERLLRPRDVEQRVAGGRHLAEPRPDDEQHVRLAHARGERRVDADPDVAGVARASRCRARPGAGTPRPPAARCPRGTRAGRRTPRPSSRRRR